MPLFIPVTAATCGIVIALFLLARRAARTIGSPPAASPVLAAALCIAALLWLIGMPVGVFEDYARPLRWALSPAIVALGAVVHRNRGVVQAQARPLVIAVVGGTLTGVLTAVGMARALHLGPLLTAALTTKTVSTPFAVAIAARVGGPVPLAAALAVLTGVVGAVTVPPLLAALRIRGAATTGIAMGQSSHLVGTDALARRAPSAASWSAVTMVLAGMLASVLLPLAWRWLG